MLNLVMGKLRLLKTDTQKNLGIYKTRSYYRILGKCKMAAARSKSSVRTIYRLLGGGGGGEHTR
jgi:hypothetical protein